MVFSKIFDALFGERYVRARYFIVKIVVPVGKGSYFKVRAFDESIAMMAALRASGANLETVWRISAEVFETDESVFHNHRVEDGPCIEIEWKEWMEMYITHLPRKTS